MKVFRLLQFATTLIISSNLVANGSLHDPHTAQLITPIIEANNVEEAPDKNREEKLVIESSRFAAPLAQKWASEYEKLNPNVDIVFVKESGESADISLVSSANIDETKDSKFIHAGRFALLPVTNADNPFLDELNKKRLDNKGIKELFFGNDQISNSSAQLKEPKFELTIYSGNNSDSFADVFAAHFGFLKADIKGKKISGDDIFLINAVQKDNEGVTYNYLNYIFDIETRSLKEGLAIIPLDLKKEYREILNEEDIDKTLTLLESEEIPLIPIDDIGFIASSESDETRKFIDWVLTEGQKYNNEYGFLKVTYNQLANK